MNVSRRTFTRQFKHEAVRLSSQPDRTVKQVALELGVPLKQLYRWRSKYAEHGAEAFPGSGRLVPADDEVVRLRRQVAELQMERDILKKAAAWFAKQQL